MTSWWNANRQDVPRALVIYLSGQTRVKDVVRLWRAISVNLHGELRRWEG